MFLLSIFKESGNKYCRQKVSGSINLNIFTIFPTTYLRISLQTVSQVDTVGLGGLGVTCSPRDPRFTGSNPAEVDGFFQDVKILSTSPLGRDFRLRVPSLRFQAC